MPSLQQSPEELAAVAEKAGVIIKSYGPQPNWSWDYPSSAGGSGLPSKEDAVDEAVVSLGLMDRGDGYVDWICDERIALPAKRYAGVCRRCESIHLRLARR